MPMEWRFDGLKVTTQQFADSLEKKLRDTGAKALRERVMELRCEEHGGTADFDTSNSQADSVRLEFQCCCDALKMKIIESLKP